MERARKLQEDKEANEEHGKSASTPATESKEEFADGGSVALGVAKGEEEGEEEEEDFEFSAFDDSSTLNQSSLENGAITSDEETEEEDDVSDVESELWKLTKLTPVV